MRQRPDYGQGKYGESAECDRANPKVGADTSTAN